MSFCVSVHGEFSDVCHFVFLCMENLVMCVILCFCAWRIQCVSFCVSVHGEFSDVCHFVFLCTENLVMCVILCFCAWRI